MAYNPAQRGTLQVLHNIAYPGAHLLIFQLMQESSIPGPRINLKPELFYFVTLSPGKGTGGDRTYDFQNKVNIKFGIHEILGLSFILHCSAVGNFASINGYSKFAQSTETKSVSIAVSDKQTKFGNQRQITIFVSAGSSKHAFTIDTATAEAMSIQLEMSAKVATQIEFTRISNAASYKPTVHKVIQPQQQIQPQMQPQQNAVPTQGNELVQNFSTILLGDQQS